MRFRVETRAPPEQVRRAATAGAGRAVSASRSTTAAAGCRWSGTTTAPGRHSDKQLRPLPGDPLAANDHTDVRWDDRVLSELVTLGHRLTGLSSRLSAVLHRFDGYGRRFQAAAEAAGRGERRRVDGLGVDSCHQVWFELHEDLLATLRLQRS